MFSDFLKYFNTEIENNYFDNSAYENLLTYLGGKQFGNGLFNSLCKENLEEYTNLVNDAYPEFVGEFKLFGYDWLGRMFGINSELGKERILMFEIGTGEVLEIPCNFLEFLNEEIPLNNNACLASAFYAKWLRKKKKTFPYGRCIGYKTPLFLGGKDTIKNLEESDMEVYWYIFTEVKKQVFNE